MIASHQRGFSFLLEFIGDNKAIANRLSSILNKKLLVYRSAITLRIRLPFLETVSTV